ncbi:DNA-3-methyladenine glycosylase I [Hyphomonas sp.]|uniref:DNA-3-methyladenine glycosylase I n=1 Tax=Hyphomonas sp. TaxID=87 RepID=UPI00391D275A
MSDAKRLPCAWAPAEDALYRGYHDTEWGVPERDPRALWEKLQLDGMQAGLSWITILRKRETIRAEFDGFDPERLAHWTPARAAKALENPGIIRSPKKIEATIGNARAYLAMQEAGEDFSEYCWGWVDGKPVVGGWRDFREAPAFTPWSAAMSKDLKRRGFKFVGPTIVYAWAQAVGMVNDHELGCPRHKAVGERR